MKLPSYLFIISILKTFTRAIIITNAPFLITQHALAQFQDNFADGDFTLNPTWTGTATEFTVNTSAQLQVNAAGASSSFLSSAFSVADIANFEWRVLVRQAFSGSANNFGRVYLVSDQQDLNGPLQGYYLQFGEAGSNDAIELFRQTGTQSFSVCRASSGGIATAFQIRIKVTRDGTGFWKLFVDYGGGTDFVQDAAGVDATYLSSAFLGVRCVFTASNATRFFYDDFYMGPSVTDTTSPEIVGIRGVSLSSLEITFDEFIDPLTAGILNNFNVMPARHPSSATLLADKKTISLLFNPPLNSATDFLYHIAVSGIKDVDGNVLTAVTKDFICFDPVPAMFKDVVLTEIFADPEPTVGLPGSEFLEIYNRSSAPFDLSGWTISDGNSSGKIPPHILLPGRFLILTTNSSLPEFQPFGDVAGISGLPSLNNSGDILLLRDNSTKKIDSINYSDQWYSDEGKSEGGWSLEIIDPENICNTSQNWTASEKDTGGTPGAVNSVDAENPDLTGPRLLSATPVFSNVVAVRFDEALSAQLPDVTSLTITPEILIKSITFEDASLTSILLTLNDEVKPATIYTITVQEIFDCAGNNVQPEDGTGIFGLPENANSLDVIVNEILFNPWPTGVDFVEVKNVSSKFINLKGWSLANIENSDIVNKKTITSANVLLEPGAMIVFTENPSRVKGEYVQALEERFLKVEDMPPFNDDMGSVVLLDQEGNRIDEFSYTEDMHTVYLKSDEGVSLERSGIDASWQSASSLSGYATPGYENSASRANNIGGDDIEVVPEIFEPVTGQPAAADIRFTFYQGNYIANVKILDAQGRTVRQLSNNDLLGTHGSFRWDGTLDDGSVARIGYYIVWFEVFHQNGAVHTYRKKVAVAARL